jgi:DNA polymerase-1
MLTVTNAETHDWGNMPLSDMAFGNAMDCDFTLRSWEILSKDVKRLNLDHVYYKLLKDIAVILGSVENRGISIDKEYLVVLEEILTVQLGELRTSLGDISPVSGINPNSTVHLGKVLFSSDGFDITPLEFSAKTKKPAITEEHLQTLKRKSKNKDVIKFIDLLLEYKSKTKQYNTYVKGVEAAIEWNEDGRIYSNYNFASTVTGRLSCSLYSAGGGMRKGVSFHTLPRPSDDDVNIRKLMVSDNDKVFITADFSTAELRVLAQCCRDQGLLHAFKTGQDLHKYTASLIYDKPVDKITKEERQVAKSVSFLIVYGGGPSKLAQQIGKSVGYAKNIFAAYQESFPKVFEWIKFVHKYIIENKCAVSLFGRRRNLPNVDSPVSKYKFRALRQGMNFVIQSSASDMMLHALKRLNHRFLEEDLDAQILATVHDSVEVQCSKDIIKEVVEMLKYELTRTDDLEAYYNLKFLVPFEVDIEVGKSFGDATEVNFTSNGSVSNYDDIINYVENS